MKFISALASAAVVFCSTLVMAGSVNGGMPGGSVAGDLNGNSCIAPALASLNKAGITNATLVSIQVRQNGSEMPMPSGYDYYFSSPSCGGAGYIVVTTTDYCYTQQVYTRYNCRIPGLSHFGF